jgi:membrane-bound lytic murein transglycosylase A
LHPSAPDATHSAILGQCFPSSSRLIASALLLAVAACASIPKTPAPAPAALCPVCPEPQPPAAPPPISWLDSLVPATWDGVEGWPGEAVEDALAAFLRSCIALRADPWPAVCDRARALDAGDAAGVRAFFESNFVPHQVVNPDGSVEGTVTGYYEPLLRGARTQSAVFRYPIYAPPEDLLVVDFGELYPEMRPLRLRGRVEGRRVVPYYSRAEIEAGRAPVAGRELLYTDDPVELFFLQIQGSGRVVLDTGETVRVSYADQNGHPYRSIGRLLVERGELTVDQASMQGIKAWGQRNPEQLGALLAENPSYVFFRELPATAEGPPGALGVALTAGRSLAVDPRAVPLGAPVFLATTRPNAQEPLRRLMLAQDTGGAIKGAVRADLYWGSGIEAGTLAGRMRQPGRLWVLLPHGFARSAQP